MSSLKLSPRLQTAAGLVRSGAVAADIGTDHGYLACALVQAGICPKVYASDVNPGPLAQAEQAVRACGLEGKVIPVLSDGVSNLPLDEISDLVIAGMGGDLILSILQDERLRDPAKRLVLQPMTKQEVLRRGLTQNGFVLCSETAVSDGRFVYTVMTASYNGKAAAVSELYAHTGLLLSQTGSDAVRYLRGVKRRFEKQLEGMRQTSAPDVHEVEKLVQLITALKEVLSND